MKVLITGSNGTIGRILMDGLEYSVTGVDLPDDLRDYDTALEACKNKDAVVHLAWDTKSENYADKTFHPDNSVMFYNVYKAAREQGVKRVVMASSVHANEYLDKTGQNPDSPYGAHKVFMEKLGEYYAKQGLEVGCIRFGGVVPKGEKPWDSIPIDGLTYPDCVDLVSKCISEELPGNYLLINGVSDNKRRVHDISNPLGWKPKLDAADFYGC